MSWGGDIVNEMVKSYGFGRNDYGDWEWSADNIAKSFQDDPFWTTVDYLVLAVPVAKWGTAVHAVGKGAKGAGIVGAAYKAGRFAGKKPTRGLFAKAAAGLVGGEKAYAAQMYMQGPSRLLGGRLANPITTKLDNEWMKLADEFGDIMQPWERRGLEAVTKRESLVFSNYVNITSGNLVKKFNQLTEGMEEEAKTAFLATTDELLEKGISPRHPIALAHFKAAAQDPRKFEAMQDAYARTWGFRNWIHEMSYELGLISKETYLRNLKKYRPHIYKEFVDLDENLKEVWKGIRPTKTGTGMVMGDSARFLERSHEAGAPGLKMIMDPRATVKELSTAAQVVSKQMYAQKLAKSAVAADYDDLVKISERLIRGGPMGKFMQKVYGLTDEAVAGMKRHLSLREDLLAKGYGKTLYYDELANILGWKSMGNMLGGQKVPGYLQRLPDELLGKYIDPTVADDVLGTLKFMDEVPWLEKFYKQTLAWFRISKTAYNPATHARNYFGNIVFRHMAVGGAPVLYPSQGIKHFLAEDDIYEAFIHSGLGGSTFTREIREALNDAFKTHVKFLGKQATGLEMVMPKALGGKPFFKHMEKAAGNMEELYRLIDEVWKLDAFAALRNKGIKKLGMSADEAAEWAVREVNMYMPTFVQHGKLTNALRQHIPFFSFTTEALRIWKNALINKPHLAFVWANMGEMLSQTIAALQGFNGEELAAAVEGLPSYMNNKQLLMLPFQIDGKPYFVDLSYIIPMANMVEGTQAEGSFFKEVFALQANPFVSAGTALLTGIDPFGMREVGPRFTERQLGIPVASQGMRRAVGLAEHAAQLVLPPVVPPGYVGVNLLELARGQLHPQTGEALEEGALRTIAANLLGMRAYAPTAEAQVQNVRRQQREVDINVAQAWDRWQMAAANGQPAAMQAEVDRLLALKNAEGHPDPLGYVRGGIERHKPGTFSNLSTKALEEIMGRIQMIGPLSERDKRIQGELMRRYQARHLSRRR